MVTPVGICLGSYERRNNFIAVFFNGELLKIYDNDKLTVMDAAVQAGYPNSDLFPKTGKELRFTVNGKKQRVRGSRGESAEITVDGHASSLGEPVSDNTRIEVVASTEGEPAKCTIKELDEYTRFPMHFTINGRQSQCPRIASVGGTVVDETYSIQNGDDIHFLETYPIRRLFEYMEIDASQVRELVINGQEVDLDGELKEGDAIDWMQVKDDTPLDGATAEDAEAGAEAPKAEEAVAAEAAPAAASEAADTGDAKKTAAAEASDTPQTAETFEAAKDSGLEEMPGWMKDIPGADKLVKEGRFAKSTSTAKDTAESTAKPVKTGKRTIIVNVNGNDVTLDNKDYYIFVDVFDAIHFDLNGGRGRSVVTRLNGKDAQYTEMLHDGDTIEVYWS